MLEKIFGLSDEQKFSEMEQIKDTINERQKAFKALSDEELMSYSLKLKADVKAQMTDANQEAKQEVLDSRLVDAFALAKEAVKREKGFELHDVQVIGGIALHKGEVAQLATGEGKTLMATLPAYLNALAGDGVHVIAPNSYLAQRDADGNGKIYERLGMSTGFVPSGRRPENMDAIKEAYAADITYASSNDLGFNYLYDGLAFDSKDMVNNSSRYSFAIIDEVDSVLLDDATTPLVISGISEADLKKDRDKAIKAIIEGSAEESYKAQRADDAIYNIYKLDREKRAAAQRGETVDGRDRLVYDAANTEKYDLVMNNRYEKKAAQEVIDTHAIILNRETGDYTITELGERLISRYYIKTDVELAFNRDLDYLTNLKDRDGNKKYKYNEDYYFLEFAGQRKLALTEHGYEKVVRDRDSEAVNIIYDGQKVSDRYTRDLHSINNSVTAYWNLKEGKDYVLSSFEDGPDFDNRYDCKKLTLVQGGRTAQGRVYASGLQIALEKKEARMAIDLQKKGAGDKPVKVVETNTTPELASISQAMFYNLYSNVGGMTGTSAKESFKMMYDWETTELPKHVDYEKAKAKKEGRELKPDLIKVNGQVYVKPSGLKEGRDEFYFNYTDNNGKQVSGNDNKINKLIEELQVSIKKGQPVLISTTSVKESEKIHQAIRERLNIDVPLLNANTKNEADIISRAGKFGAITISTEMAGRGTDIKLGGELDLKEYRQVYGQKLNSEYLAFAKSNGLDPKDKAIQKQYLDANKDKIAKKATDEWLANHELEKARVAVAGGLKVVGLGHFKYRRVDRQLIGRTARQSDPGEAIFISSEEDLANLHIQPDEYKKLSESALRAGKNKVDTPAYRELIRETQNFNENMTASAIKQTLDSESVIQDLRVEFRRQQDLVKERKDYSSLVNFMIEKSVEQLISESSQKALDGTTKLKKSKIDYASLKADAKEYLNIDIPDRISGRASVKDLSVYMVSKTKTAHAEIKSSMTKEEYDEKYSVDIMERFSNTWMDFQDLIASEKNQDRLDSLTRYDRRQELPARIKQGYNQVIRESRFDIASYVLTGKKRSYYEEKRQQNMKELKEENIQNDKPKAVKNFYTNSNISALSYKINVNKGQVGKPITSDDDMVSLKFSK